MQINLSVEQVLEILNEGQTEGAFTGRITGIASLDQAGEGDLSFLGNKKYRKLVPDTAASVVLLPEDYEGSPRKEQLYIRLTNPSMSLAAICARIERKMWPKPPAGMHATALVDASAMVDPTAHIGPYCVVEAGARIGPGTVLESHSAIGNETVIGADCWFMPRVTVAAYCEVGDRVRLHSGVVVGSDGYGYENIEGAHVKVPQVGNVVIESDVEIGANTTIDRARFNVTRIGEGTKIDNLVQIGHNVIIGKHCLIVAQAGIAGSTVLEDYVVLGGQVGLAGHLRIGQGTMVGSQGGVNHDLEPGSHVRGTPAYSFIQAQKVEILQRRLPELFKRVANIEELLDSSSATQHRE